MRRMNQKKKEKLRGCALPQLISSISVMKSKSTQHSSYTEKNEMTATYSIQVLKWKELMLQLEERK